ncbi:MAG: hypothetical protein ACYC91_00985 [Solirubrobacteraceae bacterium]
MEAAATFSRRAMPRTSGSPTHPSFIRWLWIWITVGFLVVVVVIGFLLGIVSALKSIDRGLAEANASVSGIGSEANPLPVYIQQINKNLTSINGSLKPIPHQADQIFGALSSIHGALAQVQGSLVSTSGSLVDTSNSLVSTNGTLGTISSSLIGTSGVLTGVAGSLVDTSNKLVTISGSLIDTSRKLIAVRGQAGSIATTLNNAETVGTLGTQAIWRRVRFANGGPFRAPGHDFNNLLTGGTPNPNGLKPVKMDADTIFGGLVQVNGHLASICRARVLAVFLPGLVKPGPC